MTGSLVTLLRLIFEKREQKPGCSGMMSGWEVRTLGRAYGFVDPLGREESS